MPVAIAARPAPAEVTRMKDGLDALEKRGVAPAELRGLREQLAALEVRFAGHDAGEGAH